MSESDRWYLALPLLTGTLISVVYLLTHNYPAHVSGMFLLAAELVREAGYRLPPRIPLYTGGGIPFAYPPLMFYLTALVRSVTGIPAITYTMIVPAIMTVAYLVPCYYFTRELFGSKPKAAVGTTLIAANPALFKYHLAAGGWVRGVAFGFVLAGYFTGLKVFRSGSTRWVPVSAVLFALTILTHPLYTAYFVVSYLTFYVVLDRSWVGLVRGAVVGVGGTLLAMPWWNQVIARHGVEVFRTAAGAQGGIGQVSVLTLLNMTGVGGRPIGFTALIMWNVSLFGVGYLALTRRPLIPTWWLTTGFALSHLRFLSFVLALGATPFIVEVVGPGIHERMPDGPIVQSPQFVTVIVVIAVLGSAIGGSLTYVAGGQGDLYQPSITESEVEAMRWIETHTESTATVIGLGSTAEWLPYFGRRTLLVSPWGAEWNGDYRSQETIHENLARCRVARCVTAVVRRNRLDPDYVFVPRRGRFIALRMIPSSGALVKSMNQSEEYRIAYANRGAIVYRARIAPRGSSRANSRVDDNVIVGTGYYRSLAR